MQKYKVYQVDAVFNTYGEKSETKTFRGYTVAPSPKKAIANVRFKYNITESSLYCDYSYGGYRRSHLVAEPC